MHKTLITTTALALLASPLAAQKGDKPVSPKPQAKEFQREGSGAKRARKDALEGKAPPPLQVTRWMNLEGKSLKLADLKGKVIAIKFWGVW